MLSGLIGPRPASVSHASASSTGFGEVPRAQARLGPAGPPQVDRSVRPAHLRVAADEREQVARVVGVQVRQEHLVELVDRQLQTRIVCEGAAPEVENQEVALGVTDFDEDAGRGLAARHPRIAASEHRHSHLAVLELLFTRDKHLGVFPSRRANDWSQGDRLRPARKCRHGQGHGFAVRASAAIQIASPKQHGQQSCGSCPYG